MEVLDPNVNVSDLLNCVSSLLYPAEACRVAAHWFCGSRAQSLSKASVS